MKVLNLRCAHGHLFEGWFGSDDDWRQQTDSGLLICPLCGDAQVQRLPSAPRLNFGAKEVMQSHAGPSTSGSEPATAAPHDPSSSGAPSALEIASQLAPDLPPEVALNMQSIWVKAVKHVMANTDDVGPQFPEEARRIHYGEVPHRAIRGQASLDEAHALREEGIEVLSLPVPASLKGPVQ